MLAKLRLLLRLTTSNYRRDRWRWVLTALGVAVGAMSFTGVSLISRSIVASFEDSVVKTAGKAQLQVSNGSAGVHASVVEEISALPGVQIASGNVLYQVTVPSTERRLSVFGILLGGDHSYREAQFGADALRLRDAGEFLVKVDSIALSEELMRSRGWRHGTQVVVVGPKGSRTLSIRGSLSTIGALSVFGPDVAVMDSDAAQHAFGELDNFHWIDVVIGPGHSVAEVRARITDALAGRGVVETPLGRSGRMEAMLGTLRWMLTWSAIASMLVGVFLIHQAVSTALKRRRRDLETLRAIGGSRWAVAGMVFTEAAAIGAVGAVVGFTLGVGFARASVGLLGDAVGAMYAAVPSAGLAVDLRDFLITFAISVTAVAVAAAGPCLRILRTRASSPGRRTEIAAQPRSEGTAAILGVAVIAVGIGAALLCGRFGFAAGMLAVTVLAGATFLGTTLVVPSVMAAASPTVATILRKGLGTAGVWTWQQVRRDVWVSAGTIGALAAAVSFTIGLTTLLQSYRNAITPWIAQTLASDIFVTAGSRFSLLSAPTLDVETIGRAREVEGVARAMPWRFVEVQFRDRPIIIQSAPRELIARWHGSDMADSAAGQVIVSETFAQRFGLGVGDAVTIPAPRRAIDVTIASVRPDYLLDLGSITLSRESFVGAFGDLGANILFVDRADGIDAVTIKRSLEGELADVDLTVMTGQELHALADSLIDQSFALTSALQLLAVMVTVLAMVNATTAAILDRKVELAIWRGIGMERARLVRLLAVEAVILGVFAGVLGIGSGMLLGGTLVRVVAPAVAGFRLALSWPIEWMFVVFVLSVVFAALTAALVASARMPGVIEIREQRI